jgi:putative NADH-flavin reductase
MARLFASEATTGSDHVRIAVFGANGPTGRRLTEQALAAGHDVTAVTRNPGDIPSRPGLEVVRADVADPAAVDAAVAGSQAVLSALGAPYSRHPITVYSVGARHIVRAMENHGVRRLLLVGTAALDPDYRPSDSWFYTRVLEPLFMRRPGRTLYDDNRHMEDLVRTSDLDWTIVRAGWLFDATRVSNYRVMPGNAEEMFTARPDLAACLLAQLADDRSIGATLGVNTVVGTPGIARQIWREGITKPKKKP